MKSSKNNNNNKSFTKKLIFIFIFLIDKGQKFNIKNDKFVTNKHFQFQGKKHFP